MIMLACSWERIFNPSRYASDSLFEATLNKKYTETNSLIDIFVYFSYLETSQKRNKNTKYALFHS